MSGLDSAREALKLRQGAGARYDAEGAPARELNWARLGTAYFARKLNELNDAQLKEPSGVPGWTRAEIVADVGYHARALCRQIEAVAAHLAPLPMFESRAEQLSDVRLGGTLPPRALRHLVEHAAIHLDVVWRDLPGSDWSVSAPDAIGRPRALASTALERAAVLWLAAIDLENGGRHQDLPQDLRLTLGETDRRRNLTARPA